MKPNYHVHKVPHKTKKEFAYSTAIAFGVVTELILVAAQYLFLAFNKVMNQEMSMTFSTEYMMTRGFYVFMILGIIVYATFTHYFLRNYSISSLAFLVVYLVAGAAVEIAFYLSISATFQGAFIYSIFEKGLGVAMGAIWYFAMSKNNELFNLV